MKMKKITALAIEPDSMQRIFCSGDNSCSRDNGSC